MGGLGKTTLAQLVYNDTRLMNNDDKFDLRIWVCVSQPFDVVGVARGIVESVTKKSIPSNINQLETVLEKLRDCISGKRFLLVLDDVWTDKYDEWKPLKINLRDGAAGSKILVTTRKETVAKMMDTLDKDIHHPRKLTDDECWSLMRRISLSGRSEEECEVLEKVGKKIACKCGGLPLAANVLGRLLQLKTSLEEWEDVDKSPVWESEYAKEDLFPHLILSYNELSQSLKRCFSYCAAYPKDYRFHAETLIEEWRSLGYLGPVSGNRRVELEGRAYLNSLATRSLFQDIEERGEQIEWCKMHDIVHDFALFLRQNNEVAETRERSCQVCDPLLVSQAREYRCSSWDRKSRLDHCDCVASVLRGPEGPLPQGMEKLMHLRWLDLSYTEISKDSFEIICRLYFLQTLLLSSCGLEEIPREIGNLVHLRRIGLAGNTKLEELPKSIYSLVELRTLSLEGCSLKEIPGEIGNLVRLRELNLSRNLKIKELPESICSLVELQILDIFETDINCLPEAVGELSNLRTLEMGEFKVGCQYNKLGFLKKIFHCLTRSLRLEHTYRESERAGFGKYVSLRLGIYWNSESEMAELVKDAREAQFKMLFQKLESLEIFFWSWMDKKKEQLPFSLWMEVVEALVFHHKLKKLKIRGYQGNLLPALWKLPDLEILELDEMNQLKLVGREFLGIESSSTSNDDVVAVAFPKLKELAFFSIDNWEEWEDITEEEESAAISIMPCLTTLIVRGCPSLKELPHRLLCKTSPSLRSLSLWHSSKLEETYQGEECSAWRFISQHNPHLKMC